MALILVADDDAMVCDVVRHTLSAQGHVVGSVCNGAEAIRVVEAKQPALVILDCSMPVLGGVDALRRIKTSGASCRTPVLMLTARRSGGDEEIALRAGADDYLRKPFDPADLLVRVQSLLSKNRPKPSVNC
jgi:DNA-binding response OmpR family regulator